MTESSPESGKRIARESETGSRTFTVKQRQFVRWFAICMSVFHLYTGFYGELPGYQQLSIHLCFAMVLCFLCFPFSKKSSRNRLAFHDMVLAVVGGLAAIYVFVNYDHWVNAQGEAATYDIFTGGLLLLLILEATRRSVSPLLPLITLAFLVYAYVGP